METRMKQLFCILDFDINNFDKKIYIYTCITN